jgi:hypothetical protein
LVFDLTIRIEERLKILVEQHNSSSEKIEKLMERQENLFSRISVLENRNGNHFRDDIKDLEENLQAVKAKVAVLEINSGQQENKWKLAVDFVFKLIMVIIGAVLTWKLGH